jgi:hypothetical protein
LKTDPDWILEKGAVSKLLESLGFDSPVIHFLDAAASKVAADASLKRTFLELAGDWVEGSIPDAPPGTESEITALIAVAGYPKMFATHRAREIPDSISVATARDLQRWITRPESAGGKWEFRHLRWLGSHVHHMLLEIGRLQFIALPFGSPYRVFQAKSSIQKTMVFSEVGLECSRDGWLEKSADGFITSYLSTTEELRGHPVDPASGQIGRGTVSLPTCDYDLRLSKESIALHVHIPSGQPLALSDCSDSFQRAENIYRRHFPELDWRAFCCTSWLLDRELWQCLPPHSNIQSFGNLFFPLATPGNNSDQLMERVLEGTTDWRTLSPKTSLQKAVLKHLHEGHRFRTTSGFILRTSELESALNAQLNSPNLSEKMKLHSNPMLKTL